MKVEPNLVRKGFTEWWFKLDEKRYFVHAIDGDLLVWRQDRSGDRLVADGKKNVDKFLAKFDIELLEK